MASSSTTSAAPPLIITPLDQSGNQLGSSAITLSSWALPFPKPNFTTKQRTKKTEYQGNPMATVQKLGPSFPNTVFEGRWHHRYTVIYQNGQPVGSITPGGGMVEAKDYAGSGVTTPTTQLSANALAGVDGAQVSQSAALQPLTGGSHPALTADAKTSPEMLQDFFEQLAVSGQEVYVDWGQKTRLGVVVEAEFKPERRQDIDWRLTFEWISDESYPSQGVSVISSPPLDAYVSMNMHLTNLTALTPPLSVPAALANAYAVFTSDFQKSVANLATAVTSVANLAFDFTAMSQHSLAALNTLSLQCATQYSLLSLVRADSSTANSNGTDLILFEVWRRSVMGELLSTIGDTYTYAQGFANAISPALATSWRVNQTIDMRDVSVRFYNTPLNWRALCDFNSIQGSQIPPGTLLLIPKL